jgi:hypothetical protein
LVAGFVCYTAGAFDWVFDKPEISEPANVRQIPVAKETDPAFISSSKSVVLKIPD